MNKVLLLLISSLLCYQTFGRTVGTSSVIDTAYMICGKFPNLDADYFVKVLKDGKFDFSTQNEANATISLKCREGHIIFFRIDQVK